MKPLEVVLLVTEESPSCREAERLWGRVCADMGVELQVVFVVASADTDAAETACFPTLRVGETTVATGVPELEAARHLLRNILSVH